MAATPARYGPTDRYAPAPAAGMCLSAFALVRAGGRTLLPATHMRQGEDPARTLALIMRDQLGVKSYHASDRPRVCSATAASGWHPVTGVGTSPWDAQGATRTGDRRATMLSLARGVVPGWTASTYGSCA